MGKDYFRNSSVQKENIAINTYDNKVKITTNDAKREHH